jgi:hypothetical protein
MLRQPPGWEHGRLLPPAPRAPLRFCSPAWRCAARWSALPDWRADSFYHPIRRLITRAERLRDPQLRYISLFTDYFALFLLLGIAISGVWMRYLVKADVVAIKQLRRHRPHGFRAGGLRSERGLPHPPGFW